MVERSSTFDEKENPLHLLAFGFRQNTNRKDRGGRLLII